MPPFTLTLGPKSTISITGYDPCDGVIRRRGRLQHHDGATVELTITFPLDDPRVFNVPHSLGVTALRKHVASYGGITSHAEGKELEKLVLTFLEYVVLNHGCSRPYRTPAV